jgi:hypothetical protein
LSTKTLTRDTQCLPHSARIASYNAIISTKVRVAAYIRGSA